MLVQVHNGFCVKCTEPTYGQYRMDTVLVRLSDMSHTQCQIEFQEGNYTMWTWSIHINTSYKQFNRNAATTTELVTTSFSGQCQLYQLRTPWCPLNRAITRHVLCSSHHTPSTTHCGQLIGQEAIRVLATNDQVLPHEHERNSKHICTNRVLTT